MRSVFWIHRVHIFNQLFCMIFPLFPDAGVELRFIRQGLRTLRRDRSNRPVRQVQRAPGLRRRQEGVPRLRPRGRNRGCMEPSQTPKFFQRSNDDRAAVLGSTAATVVDEQEHNLTARRLDWQGEEHVKFHYRSLHFRESEGVPEETPTRVDESLEKVVKADFERVELPA